MVLREINHRVSARITRDFANLQPGVNLLIPICPYPVSSRLSQFSPSFSEQDNLREVSIALEQWEAARFSGISVDRMVILAYVICGFAQAWAVSSSSRQFRPTG